MAHWPRNIVLTMTNSVPFTGNILALVMLNSSPSRRCFRMCASVRGHTHGSVACSVYPFLQLGPPRGAPCLVWCDCGYTPTVCTHDHQDNTRQFDDAVAIVVARLPCVRMSNRSLLIAYLRRKAGNRLFTSCLVAGRLGSFLFNREARGANL